jgi:amidase
MFAGSVRTLADMEDRFGAFCPHPQVPLEGAGKGPLAGLRFAVKDIIETKGTVACCGSPDWYATHEAAAKNAPVVERLLAAGADMVGKTKTVELAFGLSGENAHDGTPVNPAAPDRFPGGSSSGSAVAVAGGMVDFALGSDTGGSVRIPASYCGLFGIRPTHGRLPTDGVMRLAPSMDTIGWMAREADLFARIGSALLGTLPDAHGFSRTLVAKDAWALADEGTREALAPAAGVVGGLIGEEDAVSLADEDLGEWRRIFGIVQGFETWRCHREWVERVRPNFGPGVKERFAGSARVTAEQAAEYGARREAVAAHLSAMIGEDGLLCLPTAPGPALPIDVQDERHERAIRYRTLCLSAAASLAGLPEVTVPAGRAEGAPVGLSLIGPRGADERLLVLARALWARLS